MLLKQHKVKTRCVKCSGDVNTWQCRQPEHLCICDSPITVPVSQQCSLWTQPALTTLPSALEVKGSRKELSYEVPQFPEETSPITPTKTVRFSFSLVPEKCNFSASYPAQRFWTDTRTLHTEAKPNPTHKGCCRGLWTIHKMTIRGWSLCSWVNVTKVQNAGNSVPCAQPWSDYLSCQLTVLGHGCSSTQSTLN